MAKGACVKEFEIWFGICPYCFSCFKKEAVDRKVKRLDGEFVVMRTTRWCFGPFSIILNVERK